MLIFGKIFKKFTSKGLKIDYLDRNNQKQKHKNKIDTVYSPIMFIAHVYTYKTKQPYQYAE